MTQCLRDEVQITPALLRDVIRVVTAQPSDHAYFVVDVLLHGKFGEIVKEVVEEAYFSGGHDWDQYSAAMSQLSEDSVRKEEPGQLSHDLIQMLECSLTSGDRVLQARAALDCMNLSYAHFGVAREIRDSLTGQLRPLRDALGNLLSADDPPLVLAVVWALAWMGAMRMPNTPPEPPVIRSLFHLWREGASAELRRFSEWAFAAQPLLARDSFASENWGDCGKIFEESGKSRNLPGALVLAWYRRSPWSDSELAERLSQIEPNLSVFDGVCELLATLGDDGRPVLEEWHEWNKNPVPLV